MRPLIWIILLALAALALWACNGGNSGVDVPASDDGPTPALATVQASCDAIQDIERYRYSISLRLKSAELEAPKDEGTPDALSEFTDALTALFSDMQLEGAFVAPDRSQVLLRFQDQELELRTIGDKSWIRQGATWQEQEPPSEDTLLSPASICGDLLEDLAPTLATGTGTEDLVNGIETVHYRLDEADLEGLPDLLGQSGDEGLPTDFGVDVWLQRDDGWPVRLEVAASDVDEEGRPMSLELTMEFSSIDDETIEIEPPPVSPAQT